MGFRSTFISDDWGGSLPEWFKEKYSHYITASDSVMIASPYEIKLYGGNELFLDYQKALIEIDFFPSQFPVTLVVLAEDGNVTKVIIAKDKITYMLMIDHYEADVTWEQGY